MRRLRAPAALACLLLAAASLLAACGGSDSSTGAAGDTVASMPAPPKSDFPSAEGLTLAEVLEAEDAQPSPLVVSPAAKAFYTGENRYPFGVFERNGTPVPDAEVALYFAKVPPLKTGAVKPGEEVSPSAAQAKRRAEDRAREQPAIGPFPAAIESLATKPAFRAQTTTSDPDAAISVYSTQIDFPSEGEWRIAALIREDDGLGAALLPSANVGGFATVPRVGEQAPKIHTPTAADAGGDLAQVTTRIPPDTQNKVDFADALGREPIVLLFATPQFCQSRVCGPVVDVAEQVKQLYGEDVAFIHMEIYKDNDPGKGVRPQVRAYHLPSEPWLFAIDSDGKIVAAVEGAFGVAELTSVVKELTAE